MNRSRVDAFWDTVCDSWLLSYNLVAMNMIILLLLGFSFLYIEPGSTSFVIALFTLIIAVVNIVVVMVITAVCKRRKKVL